MKQLSMTRNSAEILHGELTWRQAGEQRAHQGSGRGCWYVWKIFKKLRGKI